MKKKKRKRNYEEVGHIRIPWCKQADGRTVVDPRKYGRKRETFIDHEEAILTARSIATELNEGGAEIQAFTAADRAAFAHSALAAKKYGCDVTAMTAEWSKSRELVAGTRYSVIEAVRAGVVALSRLPHPVPEIAGELLASKAPADLHGRYRRGLEKTLEKFAERFPGDIHDIKAAHIEAYLLELQTGTRRRDNVLDEIRHLFHFARLRGYLPDTISEARKIPHVHKLGRDITYFTPAEMRLILQHVEDEWLPYVTLSCFAGMRSEELARSKDASRRKDPLRWEDFDWPEREIHVRPETSKVGRKRIIPILDNAFEWLRDHHNATGPVAPASRPDREFGKNARLERTINRALERAAVLQNDTPVQLHLASIDPQPVPLLTEFAWRPNALRHSYGSYRATILKNEHELAEEMGNSVDMVRRHYRNPRPKSQAAAYFGIYPPHKPANVTPIESVA